MWAHLQREGIPVAKSTVERLMRRNRWQGVRRQKTVRTTIADPAAARPPDLVDRQFGVSAPNLLLVADFTYAKLISGVFVYVAFVIDAYAGATWGGRPRHPSTPGSWNRRSARLRRCGRARAIRSPTPSTTATPVLITRA